MSRHRAGGMVRLPRGLRFLAKLLVAVVVLTLVPTLAQAAFSNSEGGTMTLGTFRVPTPTGVDASYTCTTSSPRSATVTIRSFDAVQRATGYTVTLAESKNVLQTKELAATKRATTMSISTSSMKRTYVLSVYAKVGTWTGNAATYTFTC